MSVQVQLQPHQLVLLANLTNCISDASQQAAAAEAAMSMHEDAAGLGRSFGAGSHMGGRSFLESVLLPDCNSLVEVCMDVEHLLCMQRRSILLLCLFTPACFQ